MKNNNSQTIKKWFGRVQYICFKTLKSYGRSVIVSINNSISHVFQIL